MLSKILRKTFGTVKTPSVAIVDTSNFVNQTGNYKEDCQTVADSLYQYGCVIIKDPRVKQSDNDNVLNMFEKYFHDRGTKFYRGDEVEEFRPKWGFQRGSTPEMRERARGHQEKYKDFTKQHMADTPQPAPFEFKGRQDEMNLPNVIPKDFPDFQKICDQWGGLMLDGCMLVSQMFAEGFGMPRDILSSRLVGGDHLLAPTGSDLARFNVGTVLAGFHYDLNFLTIHGKSRFPGLFVWLRTGEQVSVSVPEGHLLLQAGKQFQYLTGGYVDCGYHEVIYTEEVLAKKNQAIKQGRIPWRVSSTLFSHIRADVTLQPISHFANESSIKRFPPIKAVDQVIEEIKAIQLKLD